MSGSKHKTAITPGRHKKLLGIFSALEKQTGYLTPQLVVDAAAPKSSPLHGYFVWDDSTAAEKYRLAQAAALIRSVRVVVIDEPLQTARAFVNIRPMPGDELELAASGNYVSLRVALSNPRHRANVLEDAMRELRAFRNKYGTLAEIAGLTRAIDRTLKRRKSA